MNQLTISPSVSELIQALSYLPGVGMKTAQRMAFYLLDQDRTSGMRLMQALQLALNKIGNCEVCRNFAEQASCRICLDKSRDANLLCIVESPSDLLAIEQLGEYRGYYFVLRGHLSPIDGIGPAELGLELLPNLLENRALTEVILATNPTAEGEATAIYLAQMMKRLNPAIKITRIAYGVPVGGELEYLDSNTLGQALSGRVLFNLDY